MVQFENSDKGKVALVTGGGIRIGREISLKLAGAGYAVAIHARQPGIGPSETAALIDQNGGTAFLVYGDLGNSADVEQLCPQVTKALGPVALLVNNASTFERDDLVSLDWGLWEKHFAVNLAAPSFLIRDMARMLPHNCTGAVVNIIDQRVWKLTPEYTSYTLTKAALWSATRTFAQALAPRIRVNAVGPGPTLPNVRQRPEDFATQVAALPLERQSLPEEVAAAVLYLATAESVTGQMIAVDGGQHLAWKTPDAFGVDG